MREMKDSGIEWIGDIPSTWTVEPIFADFREVTEKNRLGLEKKALKFTYGEIVPKVDFEADEDSYVADTILNYTIVNPGTIMLNGLNLNFDFVSQRIGLVKQRGIITSAYTAFKPIDSQKVSSEYATYLFKAYDNCKAFHNMGGGVRKILNFSELSKHRFIFPSLPAQRGIVAYLDSKCSEIDAMTADIQSQIDTLEQYKRSIITEAVTKGLDPDVEMRDSGFEWLGFIPSTWQTKKGKYIFVQRNERGNSIELQLLSPTQKYGVIPQDLYEEISGYKAVKLDEKTDYSLLKTIHKGDYCISLRSFQGGFEYSEYEGVVSPAYQVFYPVIEVFRGYYKHLFKTQTFIDKMNSFTMSLRDGKNIAFADFGNTYLPIPPIQEQQQIADYLDSKCAEIDSIITEKKQQIETIEEYKKSLIFEYVTGKKEVPAV